MTPQPYFVMFAPVLLSLSIPLSTFLFCSIIPFYMFSLDNHPGDYYDLSQDHLRGREFDQNMESGFKFS
ncbi:hypothetical protein AGMMS49587_07320 [Spirochaetia bacterium]|nr:hypothetical protein AGMMS49587_07320 [Spirochaetia bacterium]